MIKLHFYVILSQCNFIIHIHRGGFLMQIKSDRLDIIKKLIYQEKTVLFSVIVSTMTCSSITLRRDLKTLQTLTSYTHRGSYVTLPDIPGFDNFGIWFHKGIGFSKFKNSLELIIRIIEASEEGITKTEIESLLRIGISKQIQILLEQERLHRIKIGAQYVYIPNKAATDKKMRLKIVGSRQIEEHYEQDVTISNLIAVLKVVLQEGRIEMRLLKRWANKYSLKIPVAKLEHIITKYELDEKKML